MLTVCNTGKSRRERHHRTNEKYFILLFYFIQVHPCDGTHCPIGTLQSDKGDIHENAAEKSTLHPVELFRDYPKAPFYLKEGNLGWS